MKRIRSADEIYNIVENALRERGGALSAPELMEILEVRRAALERYGPDVQIATNKLSDLLGFMWRKGVLKRYAVQDVIGTRARFSYEWPTDTAPAPLQQIETPPSPTTLGATKPRFTITEKDDKVIIDFERFTLIIRSK